MILQTYYLSPIGSLLLVSDGQHLVEIKINPPEVPQSHFCANPVLESTVYWLNQYFSGNMPNCSDLPLLPKGTPFQHRVWQHLLTIPYGHTVTYGQIAAEIAKELDMKKMSAQAVGQAVGANPIPIIIPCHRVLGINKKLTGYAGGLALKMQLLDHEQIEYKK